MYSFHLKYGSLEEINPADYSKLELKCTNILLGLESTTEWYLVPGGA